MQQPAERGPDTDSAPAWRAASHLSLGACLLESSSVCAHWSEVLQPAPGIFDCPPCGPIAPATGPLLQPGRASPGSGPLSPGSYPTVIQQQNAPSQRAAKNGPPVSDQKEVLPTGVTIKQEQNLDQTYLDDGKMLVFLVARRDSAQIVTRQVSCVARVSSFTSLGLSVPF